MQDLFSTLTYSTQPEVVAPLSVLLHALPFHRTIFIEQW